MKKKSKQPAFLSVSRLAPLFLFVFLGITGWAQVKEEFKQTLPIVPGGQFRLSNVNGEVIIKAWDQQNIQIFAVKEAPSTARLPELKIEVRTTAQGVEVETIYPQGSGGGFSVKYDISVPKTVSLKKISTVNGAIDISGMTSEVTFSTVNGQGKVRGCSGQLEGQTVNGSLNVEALPGQTLMNASLSAVNGSLKLIVPDLADVQAQAETVNGSIQTDFPFEVKKGLVGRSMEGSLGSGSGRIKLHTVNGSIHLVKK